MIDNVIEKIGIDVMVQALILKGQGLHHEQADKNSDCELARAAAAYCLGQKEIQIPLGPMTSINHRLFPFPDNTFKQSSYRDDLVQACALLMHEIGRVDRLNESIAAQAAAEASIDMPQFVQDMMAGTMPAGTDFSTPLPMAAREMAPPPPPIPLVEAVETQKVSVQEKIIVLKERTTKRAKVMQRNLRQNLHSFFAVAFA